MNHVKTYTITIIPTSNMYRALCLGLPGCEVSGGTKEEALERIEDQIKARIADAAVHGRPVPIDLTSTKFLWINVEEFLV
jgi:predicted RNase H-like HicB family nuclease